MSQKSLLHLTFDETGIAAVVIDKRDLYFAARSGKTAPAFRFDNGPDYFVEGLARTVRHGKVGFVNTRLDPVIAPAWDFAAPFDHGLFIPSPRPQSMLRRIAAEPRSTNAILAYLAPRLLGRAARRELLEHFVNR